MCDNAAFHSQQHIVRSLAKAIMVACVRIDPLDTATSNMLHTVHHKHAPSDAVPGLSKPLAAAMMA